MLIKTSIIQSASTEIEKWQLVLPRGDAVAETPHCRCDLISFRAKLVKVFSGYLPEKPENLGITFQSYV